MILEGIVTTISADDTPHVAAMGATVIDAIEQFVLRPFQTSVTYDNLKRTRQGVFQTTDNVESLVEAALGITSVAPTIVPCPNFEVPMLAECCQWYAFRVVEIDESDDRARMACRVERHGRRRDFIGFNRAKHAVLELTIMATRLHLLPRQQILAELDRAGTIVEKTAGPSEARAFDAVARYIHDGLTKNRQNEQDSR